MEIFLNREHFCRQINRAMYIMHNTHLAIDWTNNELCVNNTRTSQINFVAHCMSIRPFKMIVIHLQVEKINPIILQCCAKNKARQPFIGFFCFVQNVVLKLNVRSTSVRVLGTMIPAGILGFY